MKMFCPPKKNYLPNLVDYGDDQFTLRSQDKGNTVTNTPLDSLSLQSVSSFTNKYKKLLKNKVKPLLQQNPLLNETDLSEDDNPVTKSIPHQIHNLSQL